jgi:hypothetical protein
MQSYATFPTGDSPIRLSPSLPLDEAGRNPHCILFFRMFHHRTTDEQTNEAEEFVKVIAVSITASIRSVPLSLV